jgi:hypothetical protein
VEMKNVAEVNNFMGSGKHRRMRLA